MNIKIITLSAASALIVAGCSTPVSYVDPTSSRLVTEVGRINIQDFAKASDEMTQSLIDSLITTGQLKSGVEGEPALLAISRIVNSTGEQLETDLLVKKMRVALRKTGKVQISTTLNLGDAEDPLAASSQRAAEAAGVIAHRIPDYTLSGKIIQDRSHAGNIRQSAFVFQLSLSSQAGIAVWEDEKTIVKQGNHGTVGY